MPNGNPFYVQQANIAGPVMGGLEQFAQPFEERRIAEAGQQKQQTMMKEISSVFQAGTPDEINMLSIKYPEQAKSILAQGKFHNEQTQQNYVQSLMRAHQNPEQIGDIAKSSADFLRSQGASEDEIAQRGKWEERYNADPEKAKGNLLKEISFWADEEQWNRFKEVSGVSGAEEVSVGAQEILEDGTIIQSTPKGPVVYNSLGAKVTGQAAKDAVLLGRAEKVSNLREAAGQKKAATLEEELRLKGAVEANIISSKGAADISVKAFNRLEKINTSISNMNEGIQILTDDPNMTGPVMKMLPSVRKNAIKLSNLQGRMGLDVIGNTTFGALSESELKFALSTALPTGLKGPELKEWMIQRRDAQEKLADYIEASAIFLGTPGNTVKDWIVLQKERRAERQASTAGDTQPQVAPLAAAGGGAGGQPVNVEELWKIARGGN